MSERFSRGLRIAGASWRVLNEDRKLLALPLMSFAGIAMVTLPFLASDEMPDFRSEPTVRQWIVIGCYYLLGNAIAAFFNAALIFAALARLDGGAPTLGDALRAAWQRVHRIVAWALVGAVVGVILTEIESRLGFVGRLVTRLLGTAWGALTFFVIPVLVVEDAGVFTAIGRSKDLFRKRWGEQLVGDGAIGSDLRTHRPDSDRVRCSCGGRHLCDCRHCRRRAGRSGGHVGGGRRSGHLQRCRLPICEHR